MARDSAELRYQAVESRLGWYARLALILLEPKVPSAPGLHSGRSPVKVWILLCCLLPVRAGMAALVLVPFCIVTGAITGADTLEQSLAALVLALAVSIVQTLVDPRISAYIGTMLPEDRAVSPGSELQSSAAHSSVAEPVALVLPGPDSDKTFADTVRRALTHLCDPTKLSLSPLLQLSLITTTLQEQGLEDTRLQRVAILKALLTDLVGSLRPQQRADACTSAAHRFYNCLYYPYVRSITRRNAPAMLRQLRERREREGGPRTEEERVVEWLLQVNEDTYYKWQRRASDTIALILREQECLMDGLVHHAAVSAVPARCASSLPVAS